MIDCGFPIIKYERGRSPTQWGRAHGEEFRDAIAELVAIRTGLLREKNPRLTTDDIHRLALEQWDRTKAFAPDVAEELEGIVEGAECSVTDIVILNNYTDFRDIQLDDQGCSLVYVNAAEGPLVGQTWDMHGSAKRYVCCLEVPLAEDHRAILFSIVGCVGMMGFTSRLTGLGVNNINTDGARAGAMWPAVVRKVLEQPDLASMAACLEQAPVTSGHNYLLVDRDAAQMWEVAPDLAERVDEKRAGEPGFMFHTNHCLGDAMVLRETKIAQTSTTHIRYDLLKRKAPAVQTLDQMYDLMTDHENYPKSICSNFQANSQDPSITCGGAVADLRDGRVRMWRGDPIHDTNFVIHLFHLTESRARRSGTTAR